MVVVVKLCCSNKGRLASLPENMECPGEIFCNAPTLYEVWGSLWSSSFLWSFILLKIQERKLHWLAPKTKKPSGYFFCCSFPGHSSMPALCQQLYLVPSTQFLNLQLVFNWYHCSWLQKRNSIWNYSSVLIVSCSNMRNFNLIYKVL